MNHSTTWEHSYSLPERVKYICRIARSKSPIPRNPQLKRLSAMCCIILWLTWLLMGQYGWNIFCQSVTICRLSNNMCAYVFLNSKKVTLYSQWHIQWLKMSIRYLHICRTGSIKLIISWLKQHSKTLMSKRANSIKSSVAIINNQSHRFGHQNVSGKRR